MEPSESDALLGDKRSPSSASASGASASGSASGSTRRVRLSLIEHHERDDGELPDADAGGTRLSSSTRSSSLGDVIEPEAPVEGTDADVDADADANTGADEDTDADADEDNDDIAATAAVGPPWSKQPRRSTSAALAMAPPPPPPQRYYQASDFSAGIQRTHSFPDDIYSGARFARFEIEESLRQKQGTSILDWLHAKREQLQQQKGAKQKVEDDAADHEKKIKAQHLESYDYDFFESRVNMQHDHEQTEETIRALNIGRWVMTFSIGLATAIVACFVETFTKIFSSFRTTSMEQFVAREKTGEMPFGAGFAIYAGISVGFVSVAAYMVAILCPVAGGSGISEIKATLNGIKIHRVVRFKTLFCKAFGILFSVAGGLAVGKEGPMIHSGAVIGAGLSQGKSSSFGIDTSWTKFKGFRNDKEKRDFISCGAAAGVAAAFGAPIGGVLFALEEGASFWHQNLTWRTFFCAMVSAFVFNFFISFMETDGPDADKSAEEHIFFGTLGTQTGTFSFGPFIGSKSYEILDLMIFITMGMLGGLFGAAFNQANTYLTLWRQRAVTNRWVKFAEALLIGLSMAAATFWLPYYFGECRPLGGPYAESLVTLYCPEGQYNDLGSLFTVSYSTSIKQLLHFTGDGSFSTKSLLIFVSVFYLFACWTYGIAVPSGLFVPSLLSGAAFGRLCVMGVHWFGFPVGAQDGMFALIGAASMLGGMARMTISLTVIILECTGVIEWGLPIMVSLMAARWVGNSFNEGLYDVHIHLKHLPFLEFDPPFYARFLRVVNIMSTPPVTVNQIAKVGEIYDILRDCNHGGFPVVIPGKPREGESASDARQRLRRRNKFAGLIYRRHLCVLLQRKDFFVEKPLPFTRRPAGDTTLLYNDEYALSYRDLESNYPRYPTIHDIKIDDDERDLWMDLTPYMNTTPHTVQDQTPVPRAFRLFRSLGLRHLVVLNRNNEVRGMISRKDLTPSHLKFCLESLSETEKMRIQGYFTRGRSGSERFEDVEKTLLNIVDNSRNSLRRPASGKRVTFDRCAVSSARWSLLSDLRMSSPHRGPKRGGGSPAQSAVNPSTGQATFSPRRPNVQRIAGDASVSPSAGSRLATSLALATNDSLMSASVSTPGTANGNASSGNPHVREIQSRVAELVRRYDESIECGRAYVDDDDDGDGGRLEAPVHWRVGDLLMATHSSLAKTSTRTERAIVAEFAEDSEVLDAIGGGEQSFSLVLDQAAQKTEQMKAVLAKTLQVVKQLQLSEEMDEAAEKGTDSDSQQKMRNLKITVDGLHKEKAMILAQLHEHVKSHKEMLATMEDQSQELKKAQIAMAMKHDELKTAREDFTSRLSDHQTMTETSHQNVTMWRDKYQNTLKTLGEAELKIVELEQRVHTEAEEVMKHEFVLRAKNSELEKYKERLKESEAVRMRAETAAAESASEAAEANKRADARVVQNSRGDKLSNKERQRFEAKIRDQEATIRDLQNKVSGLMDACGKFEVDNSELTRIVREMQSKAQDVMNSRPPVSKVASARRASSFALSFRSVTSQRRRSSFSGNDGSGRRQSQLSDDLSTSGSDDDAIDSEAEQDDKELNDAVLQVVTSVFPERVSTMEGQTDASLNLSIAQYEQDPTATPIPVLIKDDATTTRRLAPPPASTAEAARPASSGQGNANIKSVGELELERLQLAHNYEITRLKKQYVAGLLEYKKLIIEQYERRQSEIQQHHRVEIEKLILVVQEKFKRELERRGERVLQAKTSLKLLYRAMQRNRSSALGAGLGSLAEAGDGDAGEDCGDDERVDESVQVKSILRAAVLAMSNSKSRNKQATAAMSSIYDKLHKTKPPPQKPVIKLDTTRGAESETKPETDWAGFLKSMRTTRDGPSRSDAADKTSVCARHVACQVDEQDFVIFDLKGLRGSHVAPENLDGYLLPSSRLFRQQSPNAIDDRDSPPRRATSRSKQQPPNGGGGLSLTGVLSLQEGALLADNLVGELRALLPFLPPGSYFLSSSLRHQLLLAMLRFYSELSKRHVQSPSPSPSPSQSVEVVVGSPRDTPFLRRKALEAVDRKQRRRERLSNGGLAVLRQPPATSIVSTAGSGCVSARSMATSPLSHVRQGHPT